MSPAQLALHFAHHMSLTFSYLLTRKMSPCPWLDSEILPNWLSLSDLNFELAWNKSFPSSRSASLKFSKTPALFQRFHSCRIWEISHKFSPRGLRKVRPVYLEFSHSYLEDNPLSPLSYDWLVIYHPPSLYTHQPTCRLRTMEQQTDGLWSADFLVQLLHNCSTLAAVWDIQTFCDLAFYNDNTEFGEPPISEPLTLSSCPHSLHWRRFYSVTN